MSRPYPGRIRPYSPALVEFSRVIDAYLIYVSLTLTCDYTGFEWNTGLTLAVSVAIGLFTLLGAYLDLYHSWRVSPFHIEIRRVFTCWAATAVLLVFVVHVSEISLETPQSLIMTWFGVGFAVLGGVRFIVRGGLRLLRLRGRNFRTAAIVGATEMGARVSHNIRHTAWMGMRFVGCFDDRTPQPGRTHLRDLEVIGKIEQLIKMAHEGEVDIIYITLPLAAEVRIKELMNRLSDTTVSIYFVPDFCTLDLLHARWDMLGNIPVINAVDSPNFGINSVLKRGFDIVVSSAILSAISLPMLAIAIGIRLTSPGPIIFRQQRYGLNGQIFEIWKFRSMTVMENGNAFRQATRNDVRVTPFGAFLRRTSLDELPQFINVLQGRMSIVGPRPHPVAMNEQQRKLVERYMLRHKVKPGITGWAQVNGFRGETDTLDKIRGRIQLDLEYIDNWSFWLDIRIILRTLRVVFNDSNAY